MPEPRVEINIFDTTLRDGAQSLPQVNQFSQGAKPKISDQIARLGVDVIEAGFPATASDFEEVQDVARTVGNSTYDTIRWDSSQDASAEVISRTPIIAGLSRTVPQDIETTWTAVHEAVSPRIHTFISTDEEHMRAKFPGRTAEQVLEMGREAVVLAQKLSDSHTGASIEFSAEAASTTNSDYLEQVIKTVVAEGVDVINVPDTVGQRDPFWMHEFYSRVIGWAMSENPDITISAHNHNDLGHAASNTFSLIRAAAQYSFDQEQPVKVQAETTVCGLGERAGNADVFSVMGSIFKFAGGLAVPITWNFNPSLSVQTAHTVMHEAGLEVDRQSPIVGRDINRHRSGIHSDGIIKGGFSIYTPHDPTFWGHQADAVHEEGKYQGKSGTSAAQRHHRDLDNG